jgi:hypothetical protein
MRMLKTLMLFIAIMVAATVAGHCGSLFLRDGSELECKSFRRQGDIFIVTVNRDLVLEFPAQDVDLGKTSAKKVIKKHRKPARHPAAGKLMPKTPEKSPPAAVAPAVKSPAGPAAIPPPAAPESQQAAAAKAKPSPQAVLPPEAKEKAAPPAAVSPATSPVPSPNAVPTAKPASVPPAPPVQIKEKPLDYLLLGSSGGVVLLLIALAILYKRRSSGTAGNKASLAAQKEVTGSKPGGKKKQWQIAVLAVLVIGGGAFAYVRDMPHYSLYLLKNAMDARDAETALVYIDFESIIRNTDTNPLGNVICSIPKMSGAIPGAPPNLPQINPEEAQKMAKTLTAMMAPMLAEGFKMEFANYVKSPDQSRNPLMKKLGSGEFSDYSIDRNGKTAEVSKKGDPSVKIGMARKSYGVWRIVKINLEGKGAQ